jgi:acyl dehydratase
MLSFTLARQGNEQMPIRCFDQLTDLEPLVGQEIAVSDWLLITQDDISSFAGLTHDEQWIHVDPVRAAAESPYGTTIAHGFLTLSLISYLHGSSVQIKQGFRHVINYGLNRVRFPAPVPAGTWARSRSVLQSYDDQDRFVQISFRVTVEIQDGTKPALAAEWLVRFYRA